jgi:hypothetical protein
MNSRYVKILSALYCEHPGWKIRNIMWLRLSCDDEFISIKILNELNEAQMPGSRLLTTYQTISLTL